MGNVVSLRPRKAQQAYSEAFEAAWSSFPETGRLRSSRRLAWPEWLKATTEIAEDDLKARVERYAREDKEHRRECGAPAFHRWLKQGRWEHWEPKSPAAAVALFVKTFPDPELRASFAARFSEEALKWLDRCGWDPEHREITSYRRALKAEWVEGPFSRWAKENGVKALLFG